MILCTIPQFSCIHDICAKDLSIYQLDEAEQMFVNLVQSFHSRENDNDLPMIISRYEELFDKINTTRLVVLKILKYQPNIKPLKIDSSRLQSVINTPALSAEINSSTEVEPMLKFLAGNIE